MADVQPIRAVRFDQTAVPSLDAVTAPPYDVIDDAGRATLLGRSEHNVVELDLPRDPAGGDQYEHAASTMERWLADGILVAEDEPTIWALSQDYTGPDGTTRTRRGFLARVRADAYGAPGGVRPHERTQPGPKEDRLRLTRATRHNLSPIFSLYEGDAWPLLEAATEAEPFGEATDADGTVNRVWRIADPSVIDAVTGRLADSELLIADGHHRYETARTYADEIGGEGDHRYTLMCLVSLDDPGLTVFPTHRLLTGLKDSPERQVAIRDAVRRDFEVTELDDAAQLVPNPGGPVAFGYMDSHHRQPYRLTLTDQAIADEALSGRSDAYRRLDAALLEALILKGALGMSEDDIAAKRGLAYSSIFDVARGKVESGEVDAGFFLRGTPVDQVRAVAAAGETMPPKSTYFFPKLLTGLVFNPLK